MLWWQAPCLLACGHTSHYENNGLKCWTCINGFIAKHLNHPRQEKNAEPNNEQISENMNESVAASKDSMIL